jgi:hypothetical protein
LDVADIEKLAIANQPERLRHVQPLIAGKLAVDLAQQIEQPLAALSLPDFAA